MGRTIEELKTELALVKDKIAKLERLETKLFHMRAIAKEAATKKTSADIARLQKDMNRLQSEVEEDLRTLNTYTLLPSDAQGGAPHESESPSTFSKEPQPHS